MLAPSVSSGLITEEVSSGTLLSLRMTPLKPTTVILGKLKATFFYALIFIISGAFVIYAMAYLEHQTVFPKGSRFSVAFWSEVLTMAKEGEWWDQLWSTYRRIVVWIWILLLSTITFLTGGLFASSITKTTGIATAVSYTLTSLICLVSLAPLVLGAKLAPRLAYLILSINPIAAAIQITSTDAFTEYPELWRNNLITLGAITAFFLLASTVRLWYLFRKQD